MTILSCLLLWLIMPDTTRCPEGLYFKEKKNFQDTAISFLNCYNNDNSKISLLEEAGLCYFWSGDYKNAKRILEDTITLTNKSPEIINALYEIYTFEKN